MQSRAFLFKVLLLLQLYCLPEVVALLLAFHPCAKGKQESLKRVQLSLFLPAVAALLKLLVLW